MAANFHTMENNLSTLLTAFLDQLKNRELNLDWVCIKRNAQLLKHKMSGLSYTVDEEFNMLVDQLQLLDKHIHSIVKYTKSFGTNVLTVLDHSKDVGCYLKRLFDPYSSLEITGALGALVVSKTTESFFDMNYKTWENADVFVQIIERIGPAIQEESSKLSTITKEKMEIVYQHVKTITKQIQIRNDRLLEYDKAVNKQETLLLKKKQGPLSVKQSQQLFNLERKLITLKAAYDEYNDVLKRELPYFFSLVKSSFETLSIIIFYSQLSIIYQVTSHMQAISQIYNTDTVNAQDFPVYLLQEFNARNNTPANEIDKLSIVNFRQLYLNSLTSLAAKYPDTDPPRAFIDPKYRYCQAKFSFVGQQQGDLSFQEGDVIRVLCAEGSWWEGELNGRIGIFPRNYTEDVKNVT